MEYNCYKNENSTITIEHLNLDKYQIYNLKGNFTLDNILLCKDYVQNNIKPEHSNIIVNIKETPAINNTSLADFISIFKFLKRIHNNLSIVNHDENLLEPSSLSLQSTYLHIAE